MLQDLFLKAMRQDKKFCEIGNARAWLFEVARNAIADRLRLKKEQVELTGRSGSRDGGASHCG